MSWQAESSFSTGHQPSLLHTTKQSQSRNIPQTGHNPQPHTRPMTCKSQVCLGHAVIRHFQTHTTITHPTSRLPCPQIRADLNNPTINHILPPVIPTHYPHDIQHALSKPILHMIHNTHITLILPTYKLHFPSLERQIPQATTICITLELLMMGVMVPKTC